MKRCSTGRITHRSRALGTVVVLGSLVAGGCVSSDPYWSREDRNSAESLEAAEAAARAARPQAQPAAAPEYSAAPETRPATVESEPLVSPAPPGSAPPPEGITEETPESPEAGAAEAMDGGGSGIEQSDLDLEEPRDPGILPTPETAPAGAGDPSAGHYEASLELLQEGRLPEAEEGFRRFLAENPDSDLADNAQFWLAESALRRGDPAAALAGFRTVVENYPEANKVPDALLKVGYCLGELGERESAATVYRELVERFPESAAAESARLRLAAP